MTKIVTTLAIAGIFTLGWCASPGMKLYGKSCVECHGDDGRDTSIAPKAIGGEKGILDKLNGYRQGTFGGTQKSQMQEVLKPLSEQDLEAVASYIETL